MKASNNIVYRPSIQAIALERHLASHGESQNTQIQQHIKEELFKRYYQRLFKSAAGLILMMLFAIGFVLAMT